MNRFSEGHIIRLLFPLWFLLLTAPVLCVDLDSLSLDDSSRSMALSREAIIRGNAHFDNNEYELAILNYQEALTLDPENTMLWERLTDTQLSIGRMYDAMLSLEEAERTALNEERKQMLLLRLHKLIEEQEEAEENYLAGMVFLENGQWHKALLNFKRAIFINPTDPRYYRRSGRLLADVGLYNSAVETMKALIQLREGVLPEDALFLADLLLMIDKTGDAWRVLKWGGATFPDDQELFFRVKEMAARQHDQRHVQQAQGVKVVIVQRTGLNVLLEAGYQDGISQRAAFKQRYIVYRDAPNKPGGTPDTVGELLITLVQARTSKAVIRQEREGGVIEGDWIVLEEQGQ